MGTALLVWELGSGFGHLVNLLPLATGLRQRGHRVVAALRDLPRAEKVFAGMGIICLQAPVKIGRADYGMAQPRSFPHILQQRKEVLQRTSLAVVQEISYVHTKRS